jgi:hypothetical protein
MAADGSSDQFHTYAVCGALRFRQDTLVDDSFQSVWSHPLNLPITKTEQVVNVLRSALELPIGYPQSIVSLSRTSPEGTQSVSSTRLPRHLNQPGDTT